MIYGVLEIGEMVTYSLDFRRKVLKVKEEEQLNFELCSKVVHGFGNSVSFVRLITKEIRREEEYTRVQC